jgi:methanogenic corrinoid protein MtbC1
LRAADSTCWTQALTYRPPEKFIEAVKNCNTNIVCLSALPTVTMPAMQTTIDALKQAGVCEQVKIMVGAPVTPQFAAEIGAGGYSDNANAAVALARTLIEVGKS